MEYLRFLDTYPQTQTVKPHHRDSLGICPQTIEENLTVLFGGAGEDGGEGTRRQGGAGSATPRCATAAGP
jgi:hypothetical protein